MNNNTIMYLMIGAGALFAIIVIAFIILRRNNKEEKYIRQLQQGNKKLQHFSKGRYISKNYTYFT